MFCILARLLWLSTGLELSLSSYIFLRVQKDFFYSVFFYTSPFQQGVSLLMLPLFYSLPCRFWRTLFTPKYSILYCNLIFFACVCVQCHFQLIISCLSTPYDINGVTITQADSWSYALGSEHLSLSLRMLLFAGLCWRGWDRSEGPPRKTHAASHQQRTPPHHMELTHTQRKKKPWATSCKGTCVFWQNWRSGKNATFLQQKWHLKREREREWGIK